MRRPRSLIANNQFLPLPLREFITLDSCFPLRWGDGPSERSSVSRWDLRTSPWGPCRGFSTRLCCCPLAVKPGPPGWPGRCLCLQGPSQWKECWFIFFCIFLKAVWLEKTTLLPQYHLDEIFQRLSMLCHRLWKTGENKFLFELRKCKPIAFLQLGSPRDCAPLCRCLSVWLYIKHEEIQ